MNGQLPFEGDTFIPKEILKLKQIFGIENVVETGSQYGATLEWFINNFNKAVGCEPNNEFYNIAHKRCGIAVFNEMSIDFINGFEYGDQRTLFYIDSHWHGTPCPLKEELDLIYLESLKKEPVILIHDFKVPDHPEFGYDIYDYELRIEEIESLLNKIYPNGYGHHYNEYSNGANRGIIYIYPKIK